MSDYGIALKYLKLCFEQAVRLSDNENIYDDSDNSVSVSDIKDFINTTVEKK